MRKRFAAWQLLLVVIAPSFLFACATAHGPVFVPALNPEGDKALIYVYRETLGYFQSVYTPEAFVDGETLADLPRNSYTYTYVDHGDHTIGVKSNLLSGIPSVQLTLHAASGGVYFISYQDPVPNGSSQFYAAKLQISSSKDAPSEIKNMRHVEPMR